MFHRTDRINPILAIAIQAKSAEERVAQRREQALRAEREAANRFHRPGSTGVNAISTGIPTVCTIH